MVGHHSLGQQGRGVMQKCSAPLGKNVIDSDSEDKHRHTLRWWANKKGQRYNQAS